MASLLPGAFRAGFSFCSRVSRDWPFRAGLALGAAFSRPSFWRGVTGVSFRAFFPWRGLGSTLRRLPASSFAAWLTFLTATRLSPASGLCGGASFGRSGSLPATGLGFLGAALRWGFCAFAFCLAGAGFTRSSSSSAAAALSFTSSALTRGGFHRGIPLLGFSRIIHFLAASRGYHHDDARYSDQP